MEIEIKPLFCYLFLTSYLLSISISAAESSLAVATSSYQANAPDCVYSVYISTGYIIGAGTDANISATFYEASGTGIRINNIEKWGGLMPKGYDYFERGNIDIFSGTGPCLKAPICALNLTSDGTGSHAGWNCLALEVSVKGWGKNCTEHRFSINQWLALDTIPFSLTVLKNDCGKKISDGSGADLHELYAM